MAWAHFPMAAGDPVQPGVFAELSLAYVERKLARLGGGAAAAAAEWGAAGDDVQKAVGTAGVYSSYADWQAWVEANCGNFVRTDLAYDGGGAPASAGNWAYTLTTFRAAAGLNAAGFTRRYWRQFTGPAAALYDDGAAFANGHRALNAADNLVYLRSAGAWVAQGGPWGTNTPDTVTAYGVMQAGDFIDHLTLNEIYQAFHALRWILGPCDLAGATANEGDNNPGRGGAPSYTWATAKTDAQASWDTGTPAPSVGTREGAAPVAYSLGYYENVGGVAQPKAELQGQRMRFDADLSGVWSGVLRSVEFYAYAVVPPLHQTAGAGDSTFDANGFALSQDDWRKFDGAGPTASTAVLQSAYLGLTAATAYPAWCAEPLPAPTPPAAGPTKERGFYVTGRAAIVKFDVAGGFSRP